MALNRPDEAGWEPTRKELEIGENNVPPTTKIIYEQKKKRLFGFEVENALNMFVKTVGVFAIFLPLILLWSQRKMDMTNERRKEKALLFGQITKNYAAFFGKQNAASISLNTIDSVSFLLSSELDFADKNNQLYQQVDTLNSNLSVYAALGQCIALMDSLGHQVDAATDGLEEIIKNQRSSKLLREFRGYHAWQTFTTNFEKVNVLLGEINFQQASGSKSLDSLKKAMKDSLQSSFENISRFNSSLTENALLKYQDRKVDSIAFPNRDLISKLRADINNYLISYEHQMGRIKQQLLPFFKELLKKFQGIKVLMQNEIKV